MHMRRSLVSTEIKYAFVAGLVGAALAYGAISFASACYLRWQRVDAMWVFLTQPKPGATPAPTP